MLISSGLENNTWEKIVCDLFTDLKDFRKFRKITELLSLPDVAENRMKREIANCLVEIPEVKTRLLKNAHLIQKLYETANEYWWQLDGMGDVAFYHQFLSKIVQGFEYPFLGREVLTQDDLYFLNLKRDQVTEGRELSSGAWALMAARIGGLACEIKEIYLSATPPEVDKDFLKSRGFVQVFDPLPGDIVVNGRFGLLVEDGVLAKEGGRLTKRKVSPHVEFFRSGTPPLLEEAAMAARLQGGLSVPEELEALVKQVAEGQLNVNPGYNFTPMKIEKVGLTFTIVKIFYHNLFPDFVIKIGQDTVEVRGPLEEMETRYKNIGQAEKICAICDLDLLIIPRVKRYHFPENKCTVLIEERLDFEPTDEKQEALYKKLDPTFSETARQLAIFIAESGFHDVIPRNIPIKNELPGYSGNPRVVLLDLEDMNPDSKQQGFYGGRGSYGLVGCLFSEKVIDEVIAIQRKYKISDSHCYNKAYRMEEIKCGKRI